MSSALPPAAPCAWCTASTTSLTVTGIDRFADLSSIDSSFSITIWITSGGRASGLPTLGSWIRLGEISGAVTMKMISSTSITSMNGTMLISLMVRRPRRWARGARAGIVRASSVAGGRMAAQVAVQDVRELLDEGLELDRDAVDVVREPVVRDHRGDRGE